jgi:putative FmdB family regulatory protein
MVMPIYEYKCGYCGQKEEVIQKVNEIAPLLCSHCRTTGSLIKEVSFGSFQLKGGGWYKDLYSSNKSSANASCDKKEDINVCGGKACTKMADKESTANDKG